MGWFDERFTENADRLRFDCVACGKPMWFPLCKHGKYVTCSKECSNARFAAQKAERKRKCETCGKEFVPRNTQLRLGQGKVCSQKCNKTAQRAMNSPDAQAKSKAAWKRIYAERPFIPSGENNPFWKGGRKAGYIRRRDAGKTRIWCMNRHRRTGGKRASATVVTKLGNLQRWKCAICNEKLLKYEVDHIKPVFLGGTNDDHNLQLLCRPCNRRKHAADPIEHMQKLGFLL